MILGLDLYGRSEPTDDEELLIVNVFEFAGSYENYSAFLKCGDIIKVARLQSASNAST